MALSLDDFEYEDSAHLGPLDFSDFGEEEPSRLGEYTSRAASALGNSIRNYFTPTEEEEDFKAAREMYEEKYTNQLERDKVTKPESYFVDHPRSQWDLNPELIPQRQVSGGFFGEAGDVANDARAAAMKLGGGFLSGVLPDGTIQSAFENEAAKGKAWENARNKVHGMSTVPAFEFGLMTAIPVGRGTLQGALFGGGTGYGYMKGEGASDQEALVKSSLDTILGGVLGRFNRAGTEITSDMLRNPEKLPTDLQDYLKYMAETSSMGGDYKTLSNRLADYMDTTTQGKGSVGQVLRSAAQQGDDAMLQYLGGAIKQDPRLKGLLFNEMADRTDKFYAHPDSALGKIISENTKKVGEREVTNWSKVYEDAQQLPLDPEGATMKQLRDYSQLNDVSKGRTIMKTRGENVPFWEPRDVGFRSSIDAYLTAAGMSYAARLLRKYGLTTPERRIYDLIAGSVDDGAFDAERFYHTLVNEEKMDPRRARDVAQSMEKWGTTTSEPGTIEQGSRAGVGVEPDNVYVPGTRKPEYEQRTPYYDPAGAPEPPATDRWGDYPSAPGEVVRPIVNEFDDPTTLRLEYDPNTGTSSAGTQEIRIYPPENRIREFDTMPDDDVGRQLLNVDEDIIYPVNKEFDQAAYDAAREQGGSGRRYKLNDEEKKLADEGIITEDMARKMELDNTGAGGYKPWKAQRMEGGISGNDIWHYLQREKGLSPQEAEDVVKEVFDGGTTDLEVADYFNWLTGDDMGNVQRFVNENTYPSQRIYSMAPGTIAGVETDEEGNIVGFDPAKGLIGGALGGMIANNPKRVNALIKKFGVDRVLGDKPVELLRAGKFNSTDEMITRAKDMLDAGAPYDKIYNETGIQFIQGKPSARLRNMDEELEMGKLRKDRIDRNRGDLENYVSDDFKDVYPEVGGLSELRFDSEMDAMGSMERIPGMGYDMRLSPYLRENQLLGSSVHELNHIDFPGTTLQGKTYPEYRGQSGEKVSHLSAAMAEKDFETGGMNDDLWGDGLRSKELEDIYNYPSSAKGQIDAAQ